jgi:hypothetical protein
VIGSDPVIQAAHAFLSANAWGPAELSLSQPDIGYVNGLVAGAPIGERVIQRPARKLPDHLQQLQQREGIRRATADIEARATHILDLLNRGQVRIRQIIDEQDIAHLFAIAVNSDVSADTVCDQKPGDPPLIFDAELAVAVDARLAQVLPCGVGRRGHNR